MPIALAPGMGLNACEVFETHSMEIIVIISSCPMHVGCIPGAKGLWPARCEFYEVQSFFHGQSHFCFCSAYSCGIQQAGHPSSGKDSMLIL